MLPPALWEAPAPPNVGGVTSLPLIGEQLIVAHENTATSGALLAALALTVGCATAAAEGPGNGEPAAPAKTSAETRHPDHLKDINARWRDAVRRFRQGDYATAEAMFSRILAVAPKTRLAVEYRAKCLLALGRPKSACNDLDYLLREAHGKERARLLELRAQVWRALDKPDAAQTDYEESLQLEPSADTYASRGEYLLELGHYRQAQVDLSRALSGCPDPETRYSALLCRSLARQKLGELDASEEDATQLIQLLPEEASGWRLRGLIRFDKKQWRAAAEDLVEALARLPLSDPDVARLKRLAERALQYHSEQSM